jgi:hypothetical protein
VVAVAEAVLPMVAMLMVMVVAAEAAEEFLRFILQIVCLPLSV